MKITKEMKITIEVIPHLTQRYNTCGDWKIDSEGNINIKISEMPKTGPKGEMAVALHELTEVMLCILRGITQREVDEFDLTYDGNDEPGDDPEAPYCQEHSVATGIERIFASEAGIVWKNYEAELNQMTEDYNEQRR